MFAQPVSAQTSTSGNVNVIVAFAAGGIADAIGRMVGQKLTDRLKQSVVVENRGGAGGNLAARAVATAAPEKALRVPSSINFHGSLQFKRDIDRRSGIQA